MSEAMPRIDPRCPERKPSRRHRAINHRKPTGQMELNIRKPPKMGPADVVRRHMASILPPGVSQMYRQMNDAEFQGLGHARKAIARLTMLDGLAATIEVFGWGAGYSGHRWTEWEGPPLYFEDGRWQRDSEIKPAHTHAR